jgi:hypothetical protein
MSLVTTIYQLPEYEMDEILVIYHVIYRSRDSIVGIATGYGLDNWGVGVRVPVRSRIFSTSSRPALGSTHPHIQWVPGAPSPVVRRPGREANHSPPASAEVKKMCSLRPLYHTPSVKHRDNFTFTFSRNVWSLNGELLLQIEAMKPIIYHAVHQHILLHAQILTIKLTAI